MLIWRVMQQWLESIRRRGEGRQKLRDIAVQPSDISEFGNGGIPWRTLKIGALIDGAEFVEECSSLRDKKRIADVVRRLYILAKRALQLSDSFVDRCKFL